MRDLTHCTADTALLLSLPVWPSRHEPRMHGQGPPCIVAAVSPQAPSQYTNPAPSTPAPNTPRPSATFHPSHPHLSSTPAPNTLTAVPVALAECDTATGKPWRSGLPAHATDAKKQSMSMWTTVRGPEGDGTGAEGRRERVRVCGCGWRGWQSWAEASLSRQLTVPVSVDSGSQHPYTQDGWVSHVSPHHSASPRFSTSKTQ